MVSWRDRASEGLPSGQVTTRKTPGKDQTWNAALVFSLPILSNGHNKERDAPKADWAGGMFAWWHTQTLRGSEVQHGMHDQSLPRITQQRESWKGLVQTDAASPDSSTLTSMTAAPQYGLVKKSLPWLNSTFYSNYNYFVLLLSYPVDCTELPWSSFIYIKTERNTVWRCIKINLANWKSEGNRKHSSISGLRILSLGIFLVASLKRRTF